MGIIVGIIVTAISYMTIPLIYAGITEKVDDIKKLRTVTIISCVCVRIIYIAVEEITFGTVGNSAAAVFYGWLSIVIGKKIFENRKNPVNDTTIKVNDSKIESLTESGKKQKQEANVEKNNATTEKRAAQRIEDTNFTPVADREKIVPVDFTENIENMEEPDMAEERLSKHLKRAFIFIEDGEWKRADEYLEEVLEDDPTNALAYIGKMMIELNIEGVENLLKYTGDIENNKNFIRACRYADDNLKSKLETIRKNVKINNNFVLECKKARALCEAAKKAKTLKEIDDCLTKLGEIKNTDVTETVNLLLKKREERKEEAYKTALDRYNYGCYQDTVNHAIELFEKIDDYKDSKLMLAKCMRKKDLMVNNGINNSTRYHCPQCKKAISWPNTKCKKCNWSLDGEFENEGQS